MFPYIIFVGIKIPSYGLCMVCAVILVLVLAVGSAKRKGICFEDVIIVGAMAIGFALLGAKLLYILITYSWEDICSFTRNGNYEFLSGSGLVFLGGLFCGLVGAALGAGMVKRRLYEFEDSIVPYLPLGHAVGRVGCFFAGCCYGMPYNGPCAMHYNNNLVESNTGYFPVQLVEAIYNLVIFGILKKKSKKNNSKYVLLEFYLCLYLTGRFCLEFLRGDSERGIYGYLSTAQWMCMVFLLITLAKKFLKKGQKKNEEIN